MSYIKKILVLLCRAEDFIFPVNLLGENRKAILSACRSAADLSAGIMAEIYPPLEGPAIGAPRVEAKCRSRHRGPVAPSDGTGVAPGDGTGACPVKRSVATQTEWKKQHSGLL
jgi:hypothetical protein